MFKAFFDLNNRVWMPNHVAHEIMRNRCEVILDTCAGYDAISKEIDCFVKRCADQLRLFEQEETRELTESLKKWVNGYQKKNLLVKDQANDAILEKILDVFDGKVGESFPNEDIEKIKTEGEARFKKEIPPGYKDFKKAKDNGDNNAFGDLIVWKEILKFAKENKKDIIYVTNDKKEDWWYIIKRNGVEPKTIGPRIELKKEFKEETGCSFHMYTMTSFIRRYNEEPGRKIEETTVRELEGLEKYYSNERKGPSLESVMGMERATRLKKTYEKEFDSKMLQINLEEDKLRGLKIRMAESPNDKETENMIRECEYKIALLNKEASLLREKIYRINKRIYFSRKSLLY